MLGQSYCSTGRNCLFKVLLPRAFRITVKRRVKKLAIDALGEQRQILLDIIPKAVVISLLLLVHLR
jgi:hypothetical protein